MKSRSCVLLIAGWLIATNPCAGQSQFEVGIEKIVAPAFSSAQSGGVVLVASDDEILFRRAYGMADVELNVPMRPDHVLATGSITKQFTATAILQLAAQGRLSLEDSVLKYMPQFETGGSTITIEQVLTHTSGLPNIVDRKDFDTLIRQDYTLPELISLTGDLPVHFQPGKGFRYSDSGYFLLGAIIERVSGVPYSEYLENRLFRPLGMASTWYGDNARIIPRRAKGYTMKNGALNNADYISMTVPHAAGAVFSTVDDLLKWDRALREGKVIPTALLKRAWAPRLLPDGTPSGYAFGWKICSLAGHSTIEHGGFVNGFIANMLRLPDDHLTIIVLTNNDADVPDAGGLARRLGRFLLTGTPATRLAPLTAEQRAALIGRYEISGGDVRKIGERDGMLYSQRNDHPARPLFPLSATELSLDEGDDAFVFRFEIGPDGRAKKVRTSLRCEPADTATRIE